MADEMLNRIDAVCDQLGTALTHSVDLRDAKLTAAAASALAAAVTRRTLVAGMPVPTVSRLVDGVDPAGQRATNMQARGDVRRTIARLILVCDALGEQTAAIAMNSALIALGGKGIAPQRRWREWVTD